MSSQEKKIENAKGDRPDTHGAEGEGWYGFDLDGTLAVYGKWEGIDHIGEPVKPMCDLIRKMHGEGKKVKIVTARVAPRLEKGKGWCEQSKVNADGVRVCAHTYIEEWCAKNLGFVPEITHEKDHLMLTLFDDRVVQVVPNKGLVLADILDEMNRAFDRVWADRNAIAARLDGKLFSFANGLWCGLVVALLVSFGCMAYRHFTATPREQVIENLHRAIDDFQSQDWR